MCPSITCLILILNYHHAALLLKLEERINVIPVESKELGFTKPGSYIYELFSDLNITHETASMLIATIEDASVLLEESNQLQSKGNTCRLEHMGEILKLVFKEKNNSHAKYYRVSLHCLLVCSLWAHGLLIKSKYLIVPFN